MTPIGKIVKLLLALTLGGAVALGMSGCKKDADAAPARAATQQPAKAPDGSRIVELQVTPNGYEPSPISLKKGEPVTLKITRTTDATCARDFNLDELNIHEKLPLNETVAVKFTPSKAGELKYMCGMKMFTGRFLVE